MELENNRKDYHKLKKEGNRPTPNRLRRLLSVIFTGDKVMYFFTIVGVLLTAFGSYLTWCGHERIKELENKKKLETLRGDLNQQKDAYLSSEHLANIGDTFRLQHDVHYIYLLDNTPTTIETSYSKSLFRNLRRGLINRLPTKIKDRLANLPSDKIVPFKHILLTYLLYNLNVRVNGHNENSQFTIGVFASDGFDFSSKDKDWHKINQTNINESTKKLIENTQINKEEGTDFTAVIKRLNTCIDDFCKINNSEKKQYFIINIISDFLDDDYQLKKQEINNNMDYLIENNSAFEINLFRLPYNSSVAKQLPGFKEEPEKWIEKGLLNSLLRKDHKKAIEIYDLVSLANRCNSNLPDESTLLIPSLEKANVPTAHLDQYKHLAFLNNQFVFKLDSLQQQRIVFNNINPPGEFASRHFSLSLHLSDYDSNNIPSMNITRAILPTTPHSNTPVPIESIKRVLKPNKLVCFELFPRQCISITNPQNYQKYNGHLYLKLFQQNQNVKFSIPIEVKQ